MTSGSPRFEVLLNGEKLSTAGFEQYGVLTAIACWVNRDPSAHAGKPAEVDVPEDEYFREELTFDLSGLAGAEHCDWVSTPLRVGDELRIRVLPPGPVDDPRDRTPAACDDEA